MKKAIVIGSGFSGLSSACHLASKGYEVTVLEKNNQAGGRARVFSEKGFVFDMGPSWYWMPDVFEKFFNSFGKKVSDYYHLKRLDPSYRVYWGKEDFWDIPASFQELFQLFENEEKGSGTRLIHYLQQAEFKYKTGVDDLVYRPGLSVREFLDMRLLKGVVKLDVFTSMQKHIGRFFKSKKLNRIMEFPVLFLGATAQNTPALYSLMNYADIRLGTWYPMGGMHRIVEAMKELALELGVNFKFNEEVNQVTVNDEKWITGVGTPYAHYKADVVIASADYRHIDQKVIPEHLRSYTPAYWDKRVLAPSSLIFYLGVNKKLKGLQHHNLFFDEDFENHAKEIYSSPQWPGKPLFYVSCPSVTDASVAPAGNENLFVLIPVAPDLKDTEETREFYYDLVMKRMEEITGQSIREYVVFKRSYAHNDFIKDYHSFKGNAYGLANTLRQTAILKPSIRSKKIKNLFYAGQLTVPGPGVPPSLISGKVVADLIHETI
ncbi:MAG: phytoene desaturase [Bacteroidia bacterium]|nr:phytoene desaturase [Bacteroidia bacterium]